MTCARADPGACADRSDDADAPDHVPANLGVDRHARLARGVRGLHEVRVAHGEHALDPLARVQGAEPLTPALPRAAVALARVVEYPVGPPPAPPVGALGHLDAHRGEGRHELVGPGAHRHREVDAVAKLVLPRHPSPPQHLALRLRARHALAPRGAVATARVLPGARPLGRHHGSRRAHLLGVPALVLLVERSQPEVARHLLQRLVEPRDDVVGEERAEPAPRLQVRVVDDDVRVHDAGLAVVVVDDRDLVVGEPPLRPLDGEPAERVERHVVARVGEITYCLYMSGALPACGTSFRNAARVLSICSYHGAPSAPLCSQRFTKSCASARLPASGLRTPSASFLNSE